MAEAEAAAPPAPPPAAAAAGLIADSAARFLAGSAAGAEKSELAAASLGSLVGFDTSQLQATIGFLVESVRVLAGAAQQAAEAEERHAAMAASLTELRAQQEQMGSNLQEQAAAAAAAAAQQEQARLAAAAAAGDGETVAASAVQDLGAQIASVQETATGLAADQALLREEFAAFKLLAEELQGKHKSIGESLQETKTSVEKGDEAERRALAAEIARVEAEIAALAALREEDQAAASAAAAKGGKKKKKKKTAAEEAAEAAAAEEAAAARAVWLEGVWNTQFGNVPGIVLKVEGTTGLYGTKVRSCTAARTTQLPATPARVAHGGCAPRNRPSGCTTSSTTAMWPGGAGARAQTPSRIGGAGLSSRAARTGKPSPASTVTGTRTSPTRGAAPRVTCWTSPTPSRSLRPRMLPRKLRRRSRSRSRNPSRNPSQKARRPPPSRRRISRRSRPR